MVSFSPQILRQAAMVHFWCATPSPFDLLWCTASPLHYARHAVPIQGHPEG